MKIDDDKMFTKAEGPFAVVRQCRCCKFFTTVKKTIPGTMLAGTKGRGFGFVAGDQARGEMIQHFKQAHSEKYAELREQAAAINTKSE